MNGLLRPDMNGSTASTVQAHWLHTTVQNFFSSFNWDNHCHDLQSSNSESASSPAQPLSLDLPVSRFFAAFNWDGATIAAAPSVPQPKVTAKQEFTLDDFSGLF